MPRTKEGDFSSQTETADLAITLFKVLAKVF